MPAYIPACLPASSLPTIKLESSSNILQRRNRERGKEKNACEPTQWDIIFWFLFFLFRRPTKVEKPSQAKPGPVQSQSRQKLQKTQRAECCKGPSSQAQPNSSLDSLALPLAKLTTLVPSLSNLPRAVPSFPHPPLPCPFNLENRSSRISPHFLSPTFPPPFPPPIPSIFRPRL